MSPKLAPVKELKPAAGPENRPSVTVGDSIYYAHPEKGHATHGVVAAIGRDGVLCDGDGDEEHRVTWDKYLGHRKRADRRLHIVDRGEDGFIAQDEAGKHVFVRGSLEDQEQPKNQPADLNKALPGPVEFVPGEPTALQKAQIVRELAAAGFEPMVDYVRENFGEGFVYRHPPEPAVDRGEVVAAIERLAKSQAAQFKALCSAIGLLAERLAPHRDEPPAT